MAAAARHAASPAPSTGRRAPAAAPARPRRAPGTRARAARRSRLTRAFVVFVACLTLLAVGRVALSFAVVQKTLQTETVVREQRRLSAKHDELREQVAQLSSTVRISRIAESELGLVAASHIDFPRPLGSQVVAQAAADR